MVGGGREGAYVVLWRKSCAPWHTMISFEVGVLRKLMRVNVKQLSPRISGVSVLVGFRRRRRSP